MSPSVHVHVAGVNRNFERRRFRNTFGLLVSQRNGIRQKHTAPSALSNGTSVRSEEKSKQLSNKTNLSNKK